LKKPAIKSHARPGLGLYLPKKESHYETYGMRSPRRGNIDRDDYKSTTRAATYKQELYSSLINNAWSSVRKKDHRNKK